MNNKKSRGSGVVEVAKTINYDRPRYQDHLECQMQCQLIVKHFIFQTSGLFLSLGARMNHQLRKSLQFFILLYFLLHFIPFTGDIKLVTPACRDKNIHIGLVLHNNVKFSTVSIEMHVEGFHWKVPYISDPEMND